jgi:hypothetical protein
MMRLAGSTRRLWRTEAEGSAIGAGGTGAASPPLWAEGAGAWPLPLLQLPQPLLQLSAQPQLSQQLLQLWQVFLHLNRSNRQKLFLQQLGWQQLLQLLQHEGAQPQAGSQQAGAQPQAGSQQAGAQPQAGSQQAGAQPQAGSQQ